MSGTSVSGDIPSLLNKNTGEHIDSTEAKVELFAAAFSEVSSSSNYNDDFDVQKRIWKYQWSLFK